jgi:hypothetical protein
MSVPGSVFSDGTPTNFRPMRHIRMKFVAASTWTSMNSTRCAPLVVAVETFRKRLV